jgi:hypothetical protein
MSSTTGGWDKELAKIWINYIPPCRPSLSEMMIYAKYLKKIQSENPNMNIKMLILGSTSEFRDWGYEENLDVTVIDKSIGYHDQIKWEMRHKTAKETFVNQKWENMKFKNKFDLIVGDLVVGNLKRENLKIFLVNIKSVLKNNGYFITKSFFRREDYNIKNLELVFKSYQNKNLKIPPFSALIYDIALFCMDKNNGILNFKDMHQKIYQLFRLKLIDESLFEKFNNLGWQKNMKFEFWIPTITEWENEVKKYLKIDNKEYSNDIYAGNFPIYVLKIKSR